MVIDRYTAVNTLSGNCVHTASCSLDNAENVVSKNGKLQDKLVGVKFPGRKPFDIHIRFDLAVVLLTFTMFMVEPDHIVIRLVLTYWMEGNNSVKGKMVV